MRLHFDFISPWHCGSGHGRGAAADQTVIRDRHGLPVVPGKTVKGLFRHAVACLEGWGHLPAETTQVLFGTRTEVAGGRRTLPGCLGFADAALAPDVTAWLTQGADPGEEARLAAQLFLEYQSTAVASETGTAARHTLRTVEATIPLRLETGIDFRPDALAQWDAVPAGAVGPAGPAAGWACAIRCAMPLVAQAGAFRNRGFGRLIVREAD
ncbi:MAG: hypothetical protein HQL40_04845 [Alphaproteobacteria bacterium]|nr:hypothetical protein [Alphaproteobacteria bacterium]